MKTTVIGLALLLLFGLLLQACNRYKTETTTVSLGNTPETAVAATDTVVSDPSGNAGMDESALKGRVRIDLPNGQKLNVVENSFNYSLVQFLATEGSLAPKVFTFDNLTFESNSARIAARAKHNVDDLFQIMQAYQLLKIRIEGHTDNTGPDYVNDPLAAERAEAVKTALIEAGISANRISTEQWGYTKQAAYNQTEAGNPRNRRIDVVVTKL